MSQDPRTVMVKRAALLILSTAQREGAAHVTMGPASDGGTSIRYRIDGAWHNWSTAGIAWPLMVTELEGLAGVGSAAYPKEGVIYVAYSGVRLRWEINLTSQDNGCLLSNLAL
jgi:hypothetical protein